MHKSVINHCKKQGIKIKQDAFEIEFIAPQGKVFGNESRYRVCHCDYYEWVEDNGGVAHVKSLLTL